MIEIIPQFPVFMFQGKVSDAEKILFEVREKKQLISQVSESTQEQSLNTYKTDYERPVVIASFEEQIKIFLMDLDKKHNISSQLKQYWTAIYSGPGHHIPHIHAKSSFDFANYSGVLYLSEGSGTQFFAPNASCGEKEITYEAKFGNVLLFPSTLVHCYYPKNSLCTNDRYIMSFNIKMGGL